MDIQVVPIGSPADLRDRQRPWGAQDKARSWMWAGIWLLVAAVAVGAVGFLLDAFLVGKFALILLTAGFCCFLPWGWQTANGTPGQFMVIAVGGLAVGAFVAAVGNILPEPAHSQLIASGFGLTLPALLIGALSPRRYGRFRARVGGVAGALERADERLAHPLPEEADGVARPKSAADATHRRRALLARKRNK